jgi:hypothetical protein
MSEILSHKEAKNKGSKFYFTGKPCKRGHISKRYTCSRACIKCLPIDAKIFRDKQPDYYREYMQAYRKEWKETHPVEHILRSAKYSAKYRNIEFNLSREFVESIKISEFCPSCNKKMTFSAESKMDSPSVDRIINDIGYIDNNIIIICVGCNSDKSNKTLNWFKFWYDKILETKRKLNMVDEGL